MAQSQQVRQWEGKTSAKLPNTTPHQAWALLHGFCSLHKLLPAVDECYLVDGAEGVPGCVRRCASASIPSADGSPVAWAREKLLAMDHEGLSYTYEVVESNIGFGRYVAEMKVLPESFVDGSSGDAGEGCRLEWSFEGDPLEGWTQEGLVSFLGASLEVIAKTIEATYGAVNSSSTQEG